MSMENDVEVDGEDDEEEILDEFGITNLPIDSGVIRNGKDVIICILKKKKHL